MSGSGSAMQEPEVPEEEIDEDYEDEKDEDDSGMGAMVAGGAGLVVAVVALIVLIACCCCCPTAEPAEPVKPQGGGGNVDNPPAKAPGKAGPEENPVDVNKPEPEQDTGMSASVRNSAGGSKRAAGNSPMMSGMGIIGMFLAIAGGVMMFLQKGTSPLAGGSATGVMGYLGQLTSPAALMIIAGGCACLAGGGYAFKNKDTAPQDSKTD